MPPIPIGNHLPELSRSQRKAKKRMRQESGSSSDHVGNHKKSKHLKSKSKRHQSTSTIDHHNHTNSSNEHLGTIFNRVVDRREKEVKRLEPVLVRDLLMDIRDLTGREPPSLTAAKGSSTLSRSAGINIDVAALDVRKMLLIEYNTMSNEGISPHKRRKSWDIVSKVFRLIDTLTGEEDEDDDDDVPQSNAHTTTITTRTKPKNRETSAAVSGNKSVGEREREGLLVAGKHQKSSSGNTTAPNAAAPSARASTATSVAAKTATKTTTTTTPGHTEPQNSATATAAKKASTSEKSAASAVAKAGSRATSPVRTVASLSSASALTTATALDSNSPAKTIHKQPLAHVHPSMTHTAAPLSPKRAPVPEGVVPPPYQKRSVTAQQHRSQKTQQQQQQQQHPTEKPSHPQNHPQKQQAYDDLCRSRLLKAGAGAAPRITAGSAALAAAAAVAAASSSLSSPSTATSTSTAAVVSASPSLTSMESSASNKSNANANSNSNAKPNANVNANLNANANSKNKTGPSSPPAKLLYIQLDLSIPEVTEIPIPAGMTTTIILPADDSKTKPTVYGCSVEDRPQVSLQFKNYNASEIMTNLFLRRLRKWDPYWDIEQNFCIGLTAPIATYKYRCPKPRFTPQTAAKFSMTDLLKIVGPKIRKTSPGENPKDGEYRILIRMLPLYLSKQKDGGKHRADVHLWPKGTYLQIHVDPDSMGGQTVPRPEMLSQRKQQSHDTNKWLGICKHLDITSMVHSEWSSTSNSLKRVSRFSTVEVGCFDPELYMFSLALCKYKSPIALAKELLAPGGSSVLRRVSLEEMYERAQKLMNSNEVILDGDSDDEDDEQPKELKSIRFSIRDPITMGALKSPVRGRNCRHLSCIDLNSFLGLNKSPSGQRWKCGYCENFLSYEDLEHCALTEEACKRFGSQITNLRHMVEFREDHSMVLCKPVRSHQERARAKKLAADATLATKESSNSRNMAEEVVELLDSDSE